MSKSSLTSGIYPYYLILNPAYLVILNINLMYYVIVNKCLQKITMYTLSTIYDIAKTVLKISEPIRK